MSRKLTLFTFLLFLSLNKVSAATFHSTQTGDWNSPSTWVENNIPTASDEVFIESGHVITINGNAYTHTGNLTIRSGGELIVNCGDSSNALTFDGGFFHVYGHLTLTFPDKDLLIIGNSVFWGHPAAVIFVSDDWKVSGNAQTIVDGICVEVDDDFHVSGTGATVCGGGGVSIGATTSSNTFNLLDGATTSQFCLNTNVYRGMGGSCTTLESSGTGTTEPVAVDDSKSAMEDTPTTIDVFNLGADSDVNATDVLKIVSLGDNNNMDDGQTRGGGTVSINDNNTPGDPSDDFVDYTPAPDFVGTDFFSYVITDQNGAYDHALVTITVSASLPVSLVRFQAVEDRCDVVLNWQTESETNNRHFEIERSGDARTFEKIGQIKGSGTTRDYREYKFVDPLPRAVNYYRLKQVDHDGQYTYSDLVYVRSNCIEADHHVGILRLFPNPVVGQGSIHLRFMAKEALGETLVISDLFGRILQQQAVNISEGMNDVRMDVNELPAGTYWIRLGRQTRSFIKTTE
ncbi:MAG: Ig-like domain-containing protein [Bacteroidota bacterium]